VVCSERRVGFHPIDVWTPIRESGTGAVELRRPYYREDAMSVGMIVLIVVLVLLFGGGGGYYWRRGRG
jgi:hypothetical protein